MADNNSVQVACPTCNAQVNWHKDNEYEYLMDDGDATIKEWCSKFSKCDLYTKDNNKIPDIDKLKPYYQSLIRKYFINTVLEW